MRLKKIFVTAFFAAFFIGCLPVLILIKETTFPAIESEKVVFTEAEKNTVIETPLKQIDKPFIPQITGLKDFSDNSITSKFKLKLIDFINHGNAYRKSEVIAKSGENWLGFFTKDGNSFLKYTKVSVIAESNLNYIDEKYVFIKLNEKTSPLFLLKNSKKLKEGNIITLFQGRPPGEESSDDDLSIINRGFVHEFQVGEKKYNLRVKDALTESGDKVLALVLETENVSQIVTYTPYFDRDFLGDLLWVGDLDGDSKLDFYLEFNRFEKGSFESSLFLSSEAEKGELVKEVAVFGTLGC